MVIITISEAARRAGVERSTLCRIGAPLAATPRTAVTPRIGPSGMPLIPQATSIATKVAELDSLAEDNTHDLPQHAPRHRGRSGAFDSACGLWD
jgi:hypothetical protein